MKKSVDTNNRRKKRIVRKNEWREKKRKSVEEEHSVDVIRSKHGESELA